MIPLHQRRLKRIGRMILVITFLTLLFYTLNQLSKPIEPRKPIPKHGRLLTTDAGCCSILIVETEDELTHVIYLNHLTNDVEDAFEILDMLPYEDVNDGVAFYMRYCERSHLVQEKPKVY